MVRQLVGRMLLAAAAVLGTSASIAQSPADSEALSTVLACADVDREILRLECYDEAAADLRSRAGSASGVTSTEPAASSAPAPGAAPGRAADDGGRATVVDRPASAADSAAVADGGASARADGDSGSRTAPRPDATIEVEGGASSPAAASAARDDRGAREEQDRDRRVTIVDVRTAIPGRAVFITSDDEAFVQTSGRLRLYLPDVPFPATVRSGAVGGMFLTPEGTRRSIRVSERD
jgi:hypothetical protein